MKNKTVSIVLGPACASAFEIYIITCNRLSHVCMVVGSDVEHKSYYRERRCNRGGQDNMIVLQSIGGDLRYQLFEYQSCVWQ